MPTPSCGKRRPNCKGFLIIIDNLDRVPPHVGEHLFLKYANQLRELHCVAIYTVPISVIYSGPNYNNAFGSLNVMPMVNIYRYQPDVVDLEHDPAGVAQMAQLIAERVAVETVFESPELVDELVQLEWGACAATDAADPHGLRHRQHSRPSSSHCRGCGRGGQPDPV
jgi:hypothetical protein